jgi:hypothetical protein
MRVRRCTDYEEDLVELLDRAKRIPDTHWAYVLLTQDLIFWRIEDQDIWPTITMSLQTGLEEAILFKQRFGRCTAKTLAANLRIRIRYATGGTHSPFLYFSQYQLRPPVIVVYSDALAAITDTMVRVGLGDLFGEIEPEDILIAHELYHHIEAQQPRIATRTTRVCIWQVGPLKVRSPLIAAGEIAAYAFAKEYLQLSFFPKLVEFIAMYPGRSDIIIRDLSLAEDVGSLTSYATHWGKLQGSLNLWLPGHHTVRRAGDHGPSGPISPVDI